MSLPATSKPNPKTASGAAEELSLLRLHLYLYLVRQYVTGRGDPWLPGVH